MALLLVAGAGYVVYSVAGDMFGGSGSSSKDVTDFPGPGSSAVQVVIKPGDTGAMMGRRLVDAGVVASTGAFNKAFAANADAASIQPGTYNLLLGMRASDAVGALLNPSTKATMRVTVAEGLTAAQIYDKINATTLIPVKDLEKAATDPSAIGLPAQAKGKVEGWLFPATYDVEPGTSAADVLKQMTAKTVQVLKANDVPQSQWETVLNKASLIEREAKHDVDRPKMARVIDNRLDQGIALGIDSTTSYGLGISGAPTLAQTKDLSNKWSTGARTGLPPTPIASPGEKSIQAAMHPANGPWMFWCTVNLETGETKFAENATGFSACVAELRAWQKAHPGYGG
ncbi:endolytic transglycosylase MltG [Cellulomonas alba]|uniref:Endolytic murein transglycosylase n=1 Tax=Cellulomonas alba TaxID=3053467 RepID=A0ABT7SB56_9CELL|nr:endolytic transglycosylase MltG [Cellulomonas alba]MDM7853418.1 endolytic transglycosylase MltG [Cellulomonas alba]